MPAAVSLLLLLGVLTLFSACGRKDDGSWMRCHDARNAVAVCSAAMTAVFLLAAVMKNRLLCIILDLTGLAASAAAFMIPGVIMPMCMMHTMRCYTVMQPFVRIMTVITGLLAVRGVVRAIKKR